MNGTSGFQEVRSSTSRSPSYRLLHEQQPQFGTGAWHLLRTHDFIALSSGISTKREKVPGTIFMQVVLMISALLFAAAPAQLGQAADQCTASQGLLDIPLMEADESSWCWVASANVITNRFGYKSSSGQPYQQCELYNLAKGGTTDCCMYPKHARPTQCTDTAGMPDYDVWDQFNPRIYSLGNANPMNWDGPEPNIKAQICPGGKPGQPFIFVDQTGPVRHTNVVKGFKEVFNPTSIKTLYVDTHYPLGQGEVGPKYIDYDCGYVRPGTSAGGCALKYNYDRYMDIYDIQQGITDTNPPPAAPQGLQFHIQ